MAKFFLTNRAVNDLEKIWNYTFEKWSESQADKYYKTIIKSCKEIAKHPDLGKKYFEILPDLQGLKVNRHIIFYIKRDKDIEVIRILHQRMDLENRIKE